MNAQTIETQNALSPQQALDTLMEGNNRFVNREPATRNLMQQVEQTSGGQYPFAAILSCIDSRVSCELVFDQGIGDIFNARVAGNFSNEDILGSLEYACKVAGSKLIMVLGHSSCGAVKGACDDVKLGNITGMLAKLMPAVNSVEEAENRTSSNGKFVQNVVEANVLLTIENIRKDSPTLKEMEDNGEIKIIGACYSVTTGKVSLL